LLKDKLLTYGASDKGLSVDGAVLRKKTGSKGSTTYTEVSIDLSNASEEKIQDYINSYATKGSLTGAELIEFRSGTGDDDKPQAYDTGS
jgi:hypothetical protein